MEIAVVKKTVLKKQRAGGKLASVVVDKHPWPYCEVMWHDATAEHNWKSTDDLPNISMIVTRGWLVRTTKLCITIAASIAEIDPKDAATGRIDVGEIITIPRGCAKEIIELKVTRADSKKKLPSLH
jgi:hypothetical protein